MEENMAQLEHTEEIANEAPQEEVQEETTQEQAQEAPRVSNEEQNLAQLRRRKEEAERERDEYYKRLREYESRTQEAPKQAEIGDDDLAEGRHVKAVRQEMEQALTEMRLKTNYPDFEHVVNEQNIIKLRTAYPELASALASTPNKYNQAASTYTLIKKLGIYDTIDHSQNEKLVQKNNAKPRPLSSVSPQQGDSPLTQANAFANGLTPELKQKMYQEMMEARRKS